MTSSSSTLAVYTARIIKAGALREDTRALLLDWDTNATPQENLDHARSANIFGKASRGRVRDVLAAFRQRYFLNAGEANALAILAQGGWDSTALDRVLYFFAARSDRLLHDIVSDFLVARFEQGHTGVAPAEVEARLHQWVAEGRTAGHWSTPSVTRIARGLLATLRDFGVLSGKTAKRITPPFLPATAFAFIAFLLLEAGTAPNQLTSHSSWRLFFLDPPAVERLLIESHQGGLLGYHAAGRVVRIEFPATTPEEFARALVARTD